MTKKKLVIFDLDGTLLNTVADLAQAANYALAQMYLPSHTQEVIQTFVGNGVGKLLERALPLAERTEAQLARIRTHFLSYYDVHCADCTAPYPGIPDLLRELQVRGLQLAVASNKYQRATEHLVGHCFPGVAFVRVLGQRPEVPAKPHPAIVYEILSTAQATPAEALYVGDSAVDMNTAQSAGVDAVGVDWGLRPRAELEACRPLAVVQRPEEILQWV